MLQNIALTLCFLIAGSLAIELDSAAIRQTHDDACNMYQSDIAEMNGWAYYHLSYQISNAHELEAIFDILPNDFYDPWQDAPVNGTSRRLEEHQHSRKLPGCDGTSYSWCRSTGQRISTCSAACE